MAAPYLENLTPAEDAEAVWLDSDIELTVRAGSGSVVLASVEILVQGQVAYRDSAQQAGFSVSVVANGDGFDFVIDPDSNLPRRQYVEILVRAENTGAESAEIRYMFRTTRLRAVIDAVSPVDREQLIEVEPLIIIDFRDAPTLIEVNGSTAYNGATFVGDWNGLLVVDGDGTRISMQSTVPFPKNNVVTVDAQTASDSLTYQFLPSLERGTTTGDCGDPSIVEGNDNIWYAYARRREEGLPSTYFPGNVYARKGEPLTSEVLLVEGSQIDLGYDPDDDKIEILFEHNTAIEKMTADPTDVPSSKHAASIVTNAHRLAHSGSQAPEPTNERINAEVPGIVIHKFPPNSPLTLAMWPNDIDYMLDELVAFIVYKAPESRSVWREIGSAPYAGEDSVTFEDTFTGGSWYRCRGLFDDGSLGPYSDIVQTPEPGKAISDDMNIFGSGSMAPKNNVTALDTFPVVKTTVVDPDDNRLSHFGSMAPKNNVTALDTFPVVKATFVDPDDSRLSHLGSHAVPNQNHGEGYNYFIDIEGFRPLGVG